MNRFFTLLAISGLVIGCDGLRLTPTDELTSIEVVPGDTIALEGEPFTLRVVARNQDGDSIAIPKWQDIRWIIDEQEVLEAYGDQMTGLIGGQTRVRAVVSGLSATARVRINPIWDVTATYAYITQAIQNPENPIPIIANRKGLLRIYVTTDRFHTYSPPEVHVALRNGATVLADTVLKQTFEKIMVAPDEAKYDFSYNLVISAEDITPGLTAVVTYDPADIQHGLQGKETFTFDVKTIPVHRQMLVPIFSTHNPDSTATRWANAQREREGAMRPSVLMFPLDEQKLTIREGYVTDANIAGGEYSQWTKLLNELNVLRSADRSDDYYYGVIDLGYRFGITGVGYVGFPVSAGRAEAGTFTHELGHNLSLSHAPCGNPGGVDRNYPFRDGSIGHWGWNPDTGRLMDPARWKDLMGYCANKWIGWYHFERVRRHRGDIQSSLTSGVAEPVLLVWGAVNEDGSLFLEPALPMDMPSSISDGGPYIAEGFGTDGELLFTHHFTPSAVSHIDTRLFTVAIPYDVASSPEVSSITVSGPGAAMTLTEGSESAIAVMLDDVTGRITAIRRNWNGEVPIGNRAIYSTGLPRIVIDRR